MLKKSFTGYLPADARMYDLFDDAALNAKHSAGMYLNNRKAKGRRKVRVTVTVELVQDKKS